MNAQALTSVESLKGSLVEAVNNLDQATINKAIDDWPRRLDAVINAQGVYSGRIKDNSNLS